MKGILLILVLIALLFGTYLVYRNLSDQTSDEEDPTRIEAVEKGRKGAETLEKLQGEIHKRAQEASE